MNAGLRSGQCGAYATMLILAASTAWAGLSSVTMSFSPATIPVGGTARLTITIQNRPPPGKPSGIAFTDLYPTNLLNAAKPNVVNSCGGTVVAVPGGNSLSLAGGKIGGKNSCTVSVTVTSTVVGTYLNSSGIVTSTKAGSTGPATAMLTVSGAEWVPPDGFNAFDTTTPAGSVAGMIRTKVAASAFALDVIALKAGGSAVETAFTGDVALELVDAASGGACAGLPLIRALGTLTFGSSDQGRKRLPGINEANAWPNVRVRMRYPASGTPTVMACSSDAFAIRPARFGAVMVSDADSLTAGTRRTLANTAASGGVVHRAGRPFRLETMALNASGAPTSNYAGSPVANGLTCVLPASCVLGVFDTGSWSASSGRLVTTTARYGEVGALSLRLEDASFAVVDAADGSTPAERTVQSPVFTVGRFVPDHFDLTPASAPQFLTFNDAACSTRAFTYVGQPFAYATVPQATITAKNAAGAPTQNYAGALWKLVPAWVTQNYMTATGTLDTGLIGAPVVTASGAGTGILEANPADQLAFVRTTPVAPFAAAITLTMGVRDESEAAVTGNGIIDTASPAVFTNIAFDAGNEFRFGRLTIANAHGSELRALPVPLETQYWDGSHFVRNIVDDCTQLTAGHIALSNWRRDLAPCETSAVLSGRFVAGRGNLRLSAPGAGNTGSVDLTLQLGTTASGSACVGGIPTAAVPASLTWLQGAWSGGAYTQNPTARASFGLYRGNDTLIDQREIY